MTAKGKINASKVQINDRIIVRVSEDGTVRPSDTKTGEGVQVARVTDKGMRAAGAYEARGKYIVHTSAGSFEAAPIQTMWLASEDPAGIKRAHVEALAEDRERELVAHEEFTPAERAELAADFQTSGALDDAHAEALEMERQANDVWGIETAHAEALEMTAKGKINATDDMTGSAVVELLEMVWNRIRQNHSELPAVVIITGSGLVGARKWGHFRRDGWKSRTDGEGAATSVKLDEMFLAGETLAKGSRQVLQTMLHEAAHTLAKVREVSDTSRQNRWHNAKFKALAAELGLEHKAAEADKSHGFSFVTLTDATIERYADLLAELDSAIRLTCHLPSWLGGDTDENGGEKIAGKPVTPKTDSNNLKLMCVCPEPNIVRASRKVADKMIVKCDVCDHYFSER